MATFSCQLMREICYKFAVGWLCCTDQWPSPLLIVSFFSPPIVIRNLIIFSFLLFLEFSPSLISLKMHFLQSIVCEVYLVNFFINFSCCLFQGPRPDARIIYIDGAFDLFHAGHVEVLFGLLLLLLLLSHE